MSHDNSPHGNSETSPGLHVPAVTSSDTPLNAALAYANAGWYVVPIRRGTKHPGSVIGDRWQHQSSKDPAQLAEWFTDTDHGIALHVGRSGALVFDVDDPAVVPEILATALNADPQPPYQTTRRGTPGKGHFIYSVPADAHYGNSPGQLGKGWGEVRGRNGIIVVAPSVHEKADIGGYYAWRSTGLVPPLPDELAELLPQSNDPAEVATDTEVAIFADTFTRGTHPGMIMAVCQRWEREIGDGGSRHDAMVTATCWAAREAAAGAYPATKAYGMLRKRFLEAMTHKRTGSDRALSERQASAEFAGIWAWAVAQAITSDLDAVRARLEAAPGGRLEGLSFDPPRGPGNSAEPGASEGKEDDQVSTWLPVDLGPYLDGTVVAPEPSVLVREDGKALFYMGRLHWTHGESESGKSWVAQIAAMQQIKAGHRVLYIDHESDPTEVIGRFLSLGCTPEEIGQLLAYVRPDSSAMAEGNIEAWAALLEVSYALAIIDGITDALGLDMASSKDTDEVAAWIRRVPRHIARKTGAAVVGIDHVAKDPDRGRFAIGSQAKMAGIDGAAFVVEPCSPLGKGLVGEIVLRVAKDRPGSLRALGGLYRQSDRTQEIARITLDATKPKELVVTVDQPDEGEADPLVIWMREQLSMGDPFSSSIALFRAAKEEGLGYSTNVKAAKWALYQSLQAQHGRIGFDPEDEG